MTPLAFLDTETTSLHRPASPTPGEIWEVGLVLCDQDGSDRYRWLLPVTLEHADPKSLEIGRFHERHPQGDQWLDDTFDPDDPHVVGDLDRWCEAFATITHGAHLVGNVVSFDEERLAALLMAHGIEPAWHYHLVDSEALAAGYLGLQPPWDSEDISRRLGVTPPGPDVRHTALGDALWCRDVYDAVMAVER